MHVSCPLIPPAVCCVQSTALHKFYPRAQDLGTRAWDKMQGMILCQGTCAMRLGWSPGPEMSPLGICC